MRQIFIQTAILFTLAMLISCQSESAHKKLTGYIEADYVYVSATQSGRITEMFYDVGDNVNAGATMLMLEQNAQAIAVTQAQAALMQAQANADNLMTGLRTEELAALHAQLNEAQASLELAQVQQQRWGSLVKIGATTQANKDQVDAEVKVAIARVKTLESQIAAAQLPARPKQISAAQAAIDAAAAVVASAQWQLDQRQITSLVNGSVEQQLYRAGEFVSAGQPIYALLPNQGLKVKFFIPEATLSSVYLGQVIDVVVASETEKPFSIAAKVTFIAQSAEFTPPIIYSNESREKLVFLVEATFEGSPKLRPGQPVDVVLP